MDEFNSLYIDLDALFDTRLSLLTYIYDKAFLKNYFNKYNMRIEDRFEYITKEDFSNCYISRDKRLINKKFVTNALDFIIDFINKNKINMMNGPETRLPKLVVNLYPYQLDPFDKTELIDYLIEMTEGRADIDLIEKSYKELRPEYVKSNFSIVIKYEYKNWLEHFSENEVFKKVTMPNISLLVPALYLVKLPDVTQTKEFVRTKTTPFKETEKLVAPIIGMSFLPIEFFNARDPVLE